MKECNSLYIGMLSIAACMLLLLFLASCAKIPIRDGGLAIGKDTTASIEDIGVASVNSKF